MKTFENPMPYPGGEHLEEFDNSTAAGHMRSPATTCCCPPFLRAIAFIPYPACLVQLPFLVFTLDLRHGTASGSAFAKGMYVQPVSL